MLLSGGYLVTAPNVLWGDIYLSQVRLRIGGVEKDTKCLTPRVVPTIEKCAHMHYRHVYTTITKLPK